MSLVSGVRASFRAGKILYCLAALNGSSCSIGPYGLQAARYIHTETATVMEVYAVGGVVRTVREDRGATLGLRKSAYIHARSATPAPRAEQGWRFFYTPSPAGAPVCRASTSLGVEVQATPEVSRAAVGLVDQIVTRGPAIGQSHLTRFFYHRGHPEFTTVFTAIFNEVEEVNNDNKESAP